MSRTRAPCIVRNNYITNRFETVYLIQFFSLPTFLHQILLTSFEDSKYESNKHIYFYCGRKEDVAGVVKQFIDSPEMQWR